MQVAASRLTKRSREELPHVQGHGQRPRVPGCHGAGTGERSYPESEVRAAAGRSYPMSEASGCREETPRVRDQGQPGEATSRRRPGAVTLRSYLEPEARGGSWEELPTLEARASGWEEQPEEWWLPSTGGPRGAIPR